MRSSIFSKTAKISSDLEGTNSSSSQGSFTVEKEDNYSIIQPNCSVDDNVLPVKMMDVPSVIIQTIEDSQGRLSTIIDNYCLTTGEVCIPLEITQILPQVKNLKRYDIVEYEGKRFATADVIREDIIGKFKKAITDAISQGLSYEEYLEEDFVYQGTKLRNLVLTAKEQSFLISAFRNYHAYVYYSKEHKSLMLKVDGIT